MESKNEFKKIDIKNRVCYYFDDIILDLNINFSDILLDEELYENISVYDISYKTSVGPKPFRIKFDKLDGFIRVRGGEFRYLVIFDYGLFDKTCDKIKYLISQKSGITDSINCKFGRIKTDSYNSFPKAKILTFHNFIILIKSIVNKNKNKYYQNIFLEKGLYKGKSNTEYF